MKESPSVRNSTPPLSASRAPDAQSVQRLLLAEISIAASLLCIKFLSPLLVVISWQGLLLAWFGGNIALLGVSLAGVVKSIQLLKSGTHRKLAVTTMSVSSIPTLGTAVLMVLSVHSMVETDARMKEREREYSRIESFFAEPRRLDDIRVAGDHAEFAFEDGVSVPVRTRDHPGIVRFCQRYWVGQTLTFHVPTDRRDEYIRGDRELADSPMSRHIAGAAWGDEGAGQSRVVTTARIIVGLHSADPKHPDQDEVTRVADALRPIADTDGSGFIDGTEGGVLYRTVDFGVRAASVVKRGWTGHEEIAHAANSQVDELQEQTEAYNQLVSRIQVAGIGELPYLDLPPDNPSASTNRIPTPAYVLEARKVRRPLPDRLPPGFGPPKIVDN